MTVHGKTVLLREPGECGEDDMQLLGRRHPSDGDHAVRIADTGSHREDAGINAVTGDHALRCRDGHPGRRCAEDFFDEPERDSQWPADSARLVPEKKSPPLPRRPLSRGNEGGGVGEGVGGWGFSHERPCEDRPNRRHVHEDRVVVLAMREQQPSVAENLRDFPRPPLFPKREHSYVPRKIMITDLLADDDHACAMPRELLDPPVKETEDGITAIDLLGDNKNSHTKLQCHPE